MSTKAQARKKTKLTFLSYILRNFKRESKSNFPVTCADARILPKPARLSEHFETMVKRKREEQDLGNSEGPATKHANTLQGTRQPVYLLILKT